MIPMSKYASKGRTKSQDDDSDGSHDDNVCPECGGHIVTDYDRGERHCEMCGIVVDDNMIDHGPEYRIFDHTQEDKARVGPASNTMLHDKGLPTEIDPSMRDAYGKKIKDWQQINRLRKWQNRARLHNSFEKNLARAYMQISKVSSVMTLPDTVRAEAGHIYKMAVNNKFLRGRSVDSVIAASIYTACRMHGVPRTLDEVSQATGVGRKEVGRVYRFVTRELDINLHPVSGGEYMERFCSMFDISKDAATEARRLVAICEANDQFSGKNPMGVNAACIYIACNKIHKQTGSGRITQREIADKMSITEVTIRNRIQNIKKLLRELGEL